MNMPLVLLNRRRRGGSFSPYSLFSGTAIGTWFDPSDLSTMYQDAAGTTAVTTPGHPVGLRLDKSKGLALGAELVVNGTFDTDVAGWTAGTAMTLSAVDGDFRITRGASVNQNNSTSFTTVAGRTYQISWQYKGRSAGSTHYTDFRVGTTNGGVDLFRQQDSSAAEFSQTSRTGVFVAAGTTTFVTIVLRDGASGDYIESDNISVRELPGNHATQSVLASRPVYGIEPAGGRRNLLTYSEQFDNAAWVKSGATVAANSSVAPDGTSTADSLTATSAVNAFVYQAVALQAGSHTFTTYVKSVSGPSGGLLQVTTSGGGSTLSSQSFTGTSSWQRVSLTFTLASAQTIWVMFGGASNFVTPQVFDIWGAQLELGSTATAYQRVTTAFDVTEAGVQSCHYVQYDGSDDGMITNSIDFTATDKMSVFAGVRKLSSGTYQCIVEHGADSASVNGTFGLWANWDATNRYAHNLKGPNTASRYYSQPFVEPITNVVTSLFDLAGAGLASAIVPRVNGVLKQDVGVGGAPGGGNFISAPLYLGRRGGSSFPLFGRDYGIVVVGKATTADEITSTERWLSGKTGIVI